MEYNYKKSLSRANSSPNTTQSQTFPVHGDLQRSVSKSGSHNEVLQAHRSPSSSLANNRSPNATLQRMSSYDQTYSPARTPSGSSRLPKPRTNSNTSRSSYQTAQFLAQEKIYLKKMKNDMIDDYYTQAVISDPTDSEGDESESEMTENDDNEDIALLWGASHAKGTSLEMEHLDDYLVDNIQENPKLLERREWQTMLANVLNGDVVRSEKRRIITQTDFHYKSTYSDNLWLGLKAYLVGRTEQQQQKIIEYSRTLADETLNEIQNFKVTDQENALSAVHELLDKYDSMKELWRGYKEMANDKPICYTEAFKNRVDALISWKNITKTLRRELRVLEQWTQSQNLDLTQVRNDGFVDTSFADSLLKEKDIPSVFQKRLFEPHVPWLNKSKMAYLKFHETFTELNLPSYIPELSTLSVFPMRLIQETLKIRLAYARKLKNPTMMMIDEMIADFSLYLRLAIQIKQAYMIYRKGWDIEIKAPANYDQSVLEAVKFIFNLLHRKLINTATKSFKTFKEPDSLEESWYILKNVGCYIDYAGPEVAFQMTSLTSKLVQRLIYFIQTQVGHLSELVKNGPRNTDSATNNEIAQLISSSVDKLSVLRRKLNKLYLELRRALTNASLFTIDKVGPFLDSMKNSDHFLVQVNGSNGFYILASGSLYGRDEAIVNILTGKEIGSDWYQPRSSIIDIALDDYEEETDLGYVVIIHPAKPMLWEGSIVTLPSSLDLHFDIKPGETMLITEGSSQTLKHTKTIFNDITGDSITWVHHRSSIPRVHKEFLKSERLFFKSVLTQMVEAETCRSLLHRFRVHHDLIQLVYTFARDAGRAYAKVVEGTKRTAVIKSMLNMAIEWVSFIVDDCTPTDKKTFRWCVAALEFAMDISTGSNILTLSDAQFNKLKDKVAGCMSLLISHFDIMGARSSEAEKKNINIKPNNIQDDQVLMQHFRQQTMKQIEALEASLNVQNSVGKVLDDTVQENQYLSFLASSFSSLSMRWQKRKFLGGGTFGSVFSALDLDTGGVLAVKEIRFHDIQSIKQVVPQIKEEMTVLEMLNHPNIVQYYGVEVHRDKVNIFMEYCEGGSLASLLEHGRIEDETVIQMYTLQMFEGLAYLHEMGIVHRDIKPENILLDHNGFIKFVDFGAAKVIAKNATKKVATKVNSMTGTPMYMSPEVITGSHSSKYSLDIWSTGCCLLEMATGRRPWANLDNEWAIMYHIAAGHLPQLPSPDQLSEAGRRFLVKCLERDPNKRPSAAKLLEDPWLVDIRLLAFGEGSTSSSEVSSDIGS